MKSELRVVVNYFVELERFGVEFGMALARPWRAFSGNFQLWIGVFDCSALSIMRGMTEPCMVGWRFRCCCNRYDERVRDLLDFSIYLDISDDVKFAWKIQVWRLPSSPPVPPICGILAVPKFDELQTLSSCCCCCSLNLPMYTNPEECSCTHL